MYVHAHQHPPSFSLRIQILYLYMCAVQCIAMSDNAGMPQDFTYISEAYEDVLTWGAEPNGIVLHRNYHHRYNWKFFRGLAGAPGDPMVITLVHFKYD